jgi:hypothetical protein
MDFTKEDFLKILDDDIRFQKKWQTVSMSVYWGTTVGSVLCGSLATLTGAMNYGLQASMLAAVATVLMTVEKSLMFRERWRLHLNTITPLKSLRVEVLADQVDLRKGIAKRKQLLENYARVLPIEARDQQPPQAGVSA